MLKLTDKKAVKVLITGLVLPGLFSCAKKEYDLDNLNKEVTIAQSGLALPIGSTKQITVKDLLKDVETDVLTQFNGGYAIKFEDKMDLGENLPDFQDMIKINDIKFGNSFDFAIDGIDSDALSINGQEFDAQFDMGSNMDVDINIPPFVSSEKIALGLYKYAGYVKDIDLSKGMPEVKLPISQKINIEAPVIPGMPAIDVEVKDLNIDLGSAQENLTVKFESPDENLTNIRDLKLENGSKLVIVAEMSGYDFLKDGVFTPDITLNLGGLIGLSGADAKAIRISDAFNSANNYKITKEYAIDALNLKAENWNGKQFAQTNAVSLGGKIQVTSATISSDEANKDHNIGINLSISFEGLSVKSATMDIRNISVEQVIDVPVSLGNNGITLPEHVKSINNVVFSDNSNIAMAFGAKNANIANMKINVDALKFKFPAAMDVEGAVNGIITTPSFDLISGYNKAFKIKGITLPEAKNGVISWEDKMTISAKVSVSGQGINSADIPVTESADAYIQANANSNIEIADWNASVEGFEVEMTPVKENFSQTLPDELANYGTFTVTLEGNPQLKISLDIPDTKLDIVPGSKGLSISFPEFIKLKKEAGSDYDFNEQTNVLTLRHTLPENIVVNIDKLVLSPEKNAEGKLAVSGEFKVDGNIALKGGSLSSADLKAMSSQKTSMKAQIPAMKAKKVALDKFEISLNEKFETVLMKASELPAELVSLKEAILDNVSANFAVSLKGLPDMGASKDLKASISIDLPKEIVLDAADSRVNGNNLKVEGTFKNGKLTIDPVIIKAIDLSAYDFSKKEDLKSIISVNGSISVDQPDIDLSTMKGTVSADIEAGIANIKFSKISGKIDYKLEDNDQTVNLSDIPDMLKNEDFNLDFANPYITLSVNTNMGIPVKGHVSIIPVRNGVEDTSTKIELDLHINPADYAHDNAATKYYLAASSNGCPSDYEFVSAPNIRKLISKIPDQLKIRFSVQTDETKESILEPSAEYYLNLEYAFVCPLEFGEDLNIEVRDTIKNLDEIIGKVLQNNKIQLGGEIENSLPVQLELIIDPLDKNNKVIKMETKASQVINACASTGQASKTPLDLTLNVGNADMTDFQSLMLTFKVTSGNVTGIPVKEDSYVQAMLKLLLPEGVTLDLDELK